MIRPALSVLALALTLVLSAPARAHDGNFGLGVIAGEPTGVSGKLWLSAATAVDGAMAWSTAADGRLHLQADFVWHDFDLFEVDRGALPVYYGVGARVRFAERDDVIGVRFPVGLSYLFEGRRFDAFMEVAPILDLAPSTDVDVEGGLGVRYYFR